ETMLAGPVDASVPAVLFHREDGFRPQLSWEQLRANVAATASALRANRVGPGDRVAPWLPNCPEALVVMLACLSVGAVYSSTSPDFGAAGVIDRFGQIEPSVLFAADGYLYGGTRHDCLGRLATIRAGLPSVTDTVVIGSLADEPDLGGVP